MFRCWHRCVWPNNLDFYRRNRYFGESRYGFFSLYKVYQKWYIQKLNYKKYYIILQIVINHTPITQWLFLNTMTFTPSRSETYTQRYSHLKKERWKPTWSTFHHSKLCGCTRPLLNCCVIRLLIGPLRFSPLFFIF